MSVPDQTSFESPASSQNQVILKRCVLTKNQASSTQQSLVVTEVEVTGKAAWRRTWGLCS